MIVQPLDVERHTRPRHQEIGDPEVPDLAEVRGQQAAKRALEVAAAGGHNLLFIGPPGSGKTMLARRLPGILPPLTLAESIAIENPWSNGRLTAYTTIFCYNSEYKASLRSFGKSSSG